MTHSHSDQPAAPSSPIKLDGAQIHGTAEAVSILHQRVRAVRVEMKHLENTVDLVRLMLPLAPPANETETPVTSEDLVDHQATMNIVLRAATEALNKQWRLTARELHVLLEELDLNLPI